MMKTLGAAAVLVLLTTWSVAAAQPVTLNVWPDTAPGEDGKVGPEKVLERKPEEKKLHLITNVTVPTLTVFRPEPAKDTGAVVVICPGGGYHVLAWDLEGEEVAAWLNSLGVTGIVLKYRVPRRADAPKDGQPVQPVQDVQRALSLVRGKAAAWKLDPARIGVLGFSAGGHLAASAATRYNERAYPPVDDVDKVSCRPDFAILVYPAYLVTKDKTKLVPEIAVTKATPPTFLVHAGNDPIPVENSVQMYLALHKAGVAAELHVYPTGGHGYGLRPTEHPVTAWPGRCADWLRTQGILKREPTSGKTSPPQEAPR